ncbi:hypothetical protein BT93_B0696 [Corymbia citriodora subsp. variegata]|nr:hypothetical protein BT93_B0696 [Corymbia citriodora subsp. variegata]
MGGVGKTALAQRVYNDPRVSSCFERRAWVCVSDVFDVLNITKTILQSITGLSCEGKDLNWLQVKLKDDLIGKKFLVVLDDVWNEKYGEWTTLLKPFELGAKGSKIIVTTRNLSVAFLTGALPYPLKELSLGSCTSLLAYHALGTRNFERHPDLVIVGKKIVEKCKGLPLVAKLLGGLLRNRKNPDAWEAILNNRIWDLEARENNEILPALKLSYTHLPSYLKRCFAYCAIFPKDYKIDKDELVLLWIAEGFLDGLKEKENILRLGRNYFDELVLKSFFQQSSVDTSKFSMHDLLNDLAKSIAGATCVTFGESPLAGDEVDVSLQEKARYASLIVPWSVTSRCLRAYNGMKVLRSLTLLHIGFSWCSRKFCISNKVLHDLLSKLKYLRVFSLSHCSIIEVPNCVGDLKHLRYLNFSYTDIERLPESIGALCKLQVLILRGCQKLSILPHGITKLVNLQFLDIRDTGSLKEMPLNISYLKNLSILPKFVIGLEKGLQLKELKNLPHLQGELIISELQKVEEVRDAIDANLFRKQGLRKLVLHWDKDFGNLRNDEHQAQVLHYLRPHTNLENLTISYYEGAIFPSWLDGPSYSKIVSLCLCGCPNVRSLPSLGQLPSLTELSLVGLHAVSMIGSEFYGIKKPFASLKTLKFKEMLAWKDWSHYVGNQEEVPFSCLQHLVIWHCPTLIGTLPCQLDHLIKLEIHSCPHLNISTNVICLPSLRELYLEDCHKEILKSMVSLTSLTILKIKNLAELICFDHGFMSCLVKLKELHIRSCDKLTYLWQDGDETQNLNCLQELAIERCPQFISFVAREGEIELPCNLDRMELRDCMSLEKLPSNTLKDLCIWNCPKIVGLAIPSYDPNSNNPKSQLESLRIGESDSLTSFSFAKGRLISLKTLYIYKCKGMESLEEITVESLNSLSIVSCQNMRILSQCFHTLPHLVELNIRDCPALEIEYFPPLPITLSSLRLYNCPNIKSIASRNNLTKLEIWDCPALEIEDFSPLPITLSSFTLIDCPKIKSLPNQWHHLTSLQSLRIENCQNIKFFPKGGLPPNLQVLAFVGCKNLKQPIREWGLHLLTSLERLSVDFSMGGEGEKVWFPSEDKDAWSLLFPSSLTYLHLRNMRKVERLSSGFCKYLSSLIYLGIEGCPKLRHLPEDGLPPSLQQLYICRCEILKDQCSKLIGDYWLLIQEIPNIYIGTDRIQ